MSKSSTSTYLYILTALAFAASSVWAQSSPAGGNRSINTSTDIMNDGVDPGAIAFMSGTAASGKAQAIWSRWTTGQPEHVMELPFEYVGGHVKVSESQWIVSGRSDGSTFTGYICRVELDFTSQQVLLRETVAYPGWDPFAIAWNSTTGLFGVLDIGNQQLRVTSFSGWPTPATTPVLPPPAAFGPVLGAVDLPALTGPDPQLSIDSVTGYFRVAGSSRSGAVIAQPISGVWQAGDASETSWNNTWVADAGAGHMVDLRVATTAATIGQDASFDIKMLSTGSIVASGVVTAPREWVNVTTPTEFYDFPGYEFAVEGPQSVSSDSFRPLVRYGLPQSAGDYSPGYGMVNSEAVFVSSDEFFVGAPLKIQSLDPVPGAGVPVNVFLWVDFGFRGPGAPPDPVTVMGDVAILTSPMSYPIDHVQSLETSGAARVLSVPNNSDLEGSIALFQLVFQDPTDLGVVAISDVFGTTILANPAQQLLGGGAGRSPINLCMRACQQWKSEQQRSNPGQVAYTRALQRAVLNQIVGR